MSYHVPPSLMKRFTFLVVLALIALPVQSHAYVGKLQFAKPTARSVHHSSVSQFWHNARSSRCYQRFSRSQTKDFIHAFDRGS